MCGGGFRGVGWRELRRFPAPLPGGGYEEVMGSGGVTTGYRMGPLRGGREIW